MPAARFVQDLDPVGNRLLSTLFAASPVLVLFYLLVARRWLAPKAGLAGAVTAILVAWLVFGMPIEMAGWSFVHGVGFGLLPIGWTVFCAMLLYNITVETGQFHHIRRSVSGLSRDVRVQAVLIGFAFGAFLEGAAGAGTPVAVCGAMLVGLGFHPIQAAVLCLIANTSPVAYGGLGMPIITLHGVTDLSGDTISVMAGHQLPILSCLVPLYMVKTMGTWRQTLEVWPVLLVGGGSFALLQFLLATLHAYIPGVVVWYMTDVGGGIGSLLVLAVFLRYWQPRTILRAEPTPTPPPPATSPADAQERAAADEVQSLLSEPPVDDSVPLTASAILRAWSPFMMMSCFLVATSFLRSAEAKEVVKFGPIQSVYQIEIPTLHLECERPQRLQKPDLSEPEQEKAEFRFAWLSAPGTPVLFSCFASMLLLRMSRRQIRAVWRKTLVQMKIPIPTIACMLGLSYVTRYAGMDATLGVAFAETGMLYPFFAALLGWLGVFLTGTDAGSNALFGSLQKITATELWNTGSLQEHLRLEQAQILICTANSTGGVMGKMIDAQSICVATAATNQIGREADIFKAVIGHSIFLASIVGGLTLLQAYVPPFTRMVPG